MLKEVKQGLRVHDADPKKSEVKKLLSYAKKYFDSIYYSALAVEMDQLKEILKDAKAHILKSTSYYWKKENLTDKKVEEILSNLYHGDGGRIFSNIGEEGALCYIRQNKDGVFKKVFYGLKEVLNVEFKKIFPPKNVFNLVLKHLNSVDTFNLRGTCQQAQIWVTDYQKINNNLIISEIQKGDLEKASIIFRENKERYLNPESFQIILEKNYEYNRNNTLVNQMIAETNPELMDLFFPTNYIESQIKLAARKGQLEFVQMLLSILKKKLGKLFIVDFNYIYHEHLRFAIDEASKSGQLLIIRTILPNLKDDLYSQMGLTCRVIELAIENGHKNIVQYFLEKNTDITSQLDFENLINLAIRRRKNRNNEIINLLKEHQYASSNVIEVF